MPPRLQLSRPFWRQLIAELHRRGGERREAGALLLGSRSAAGTVSANRAVYYDDIDPNALNAGYVHLDCRRLGAVWALCRETGVSVVADVHTHPGLALQSSSDRASPMIPRSGHLALIVPNYAVRPVLLSDVGIFEYLGSRRWRTLSDLRRPTAALNVQGY